MSVLKTIWLTIEQFPSVREFSTTPPDMQYLDFKFLYAKQGPVDVPVATKQELPNLRLNRV